MRTNRFWKSGRWGALLLAVLAVALVGIAIVFAATQVFVVTPTALQDWQIRNTAGAQPTPASTPSVTFVNGPDTPPLSNGSVQLSVGSDGSAAAQLRQPDYAGTVLPNPNPSPDAFPAGNELTALSYSTYVQVGGSASQAPYIILDVDYDNNGTIDDHLVFEPQYQIAGFCPSNPQGPVTSGVWQSWDAFNGCWYSTSGAAGSGPGANVKVLTAFSSAQPSATIVNVGNGDGGVRLVAGLGGVIGGGSASDWAGFVGNADAFLIGVGFDTDTGPEARDYDFEPSTPTPSNVDLGVLKTANPTQTMPDHDVTYTIKVQNLGGADAMNATLNDTLPSDMTFVSLSSAAGWMCSTPSVGMGGLVTCSNPSVSGGANDTFTLVGHIPSSAADGSSYINTATVTTDSTDSFDENNSSTAETDVFTFINQAPTFTKGPDQTVNEDAGPQTVSHWATGMSPGPANESGQSLNFIVTNNSNPGLFSAGPSIDATTGTLTYTPAPNAFGTATITIVLMDNGGTDHGGQDTSAPQSFTITVNPVPDTPSVTNASTTVNAQTTSGLVISRNPADGSEVTNFKITNIAGGTLFKNNGTTQINNNDFISFAEGNAGLKFTPALNSTATGSFQVQASLNNTDGGLGGGLATATISVACGSTVVTNSNDSGAGSLRDTILHACTGATLTFDMSAGHVTNAINLTTAELVIDKSLVIQGPRADALTIERNAASQFRVFNITTAVSATISGLTIANGNGGFQGGGISNSNNALLTLNGVVMSGNTAQFGGGVFNFGSGNVSVLNSTISGNTATTSGGGLYNNGPGPEIMTVSNSTISGNTAGSGGGIFNVQAHLNIVSATIVNNSAPGGTGAGGGIYNNSAAPPAAAAVSDSIIATPAATIGNTIVAGNSAGTANGPDIQGAISSQGNNLVGAKDGSSGLTNGVNNDIVGTIANPVNPLLAVLGNYGGPTLTAPPVPGSPVIDAGSSTLDNSSGLTSDQRGTGFNRIVGASADIGAFESRGFTIAIVSGTPQSTPILSSFASPLVISVTAVGNEPTSGGAITFTAPASGASATVNGGNNVRALIGAGQASVSAIANGLAGSYNVTATTANANSVSFSLTNNKAATTTTVASSLNPSDLNQNVTFTATVSSVAIPTGTVQFKDNGTNLGSPVTLNAGGVAQLTTSSLTTGGHNITAVYSGDANFLTSTGTLSGGQTVLFRPLLKFSQPTFSTNENAGFVAITVIRFGDTSLAATVDYATPDDSAATSVLPCSTANGVGSPRCDFETALGTLRFGPGETSKTFTVLITQDLWLEGNETVPLTLSNPTGGAAFQQPSDANAVLTIIDDDVTTPTTNAIDNTDTFVRQQYHDFLNREADPAGLAFWTDNINKCNDATRRPAGQTAAQCIEIQRINTSAAFFLSIEFQNTGYFVERMYKSAFGDILPPTVPVPIRYTTFLTDTQLVEQGVIVGQGNWQAQLDANKKAFALAFVQRPAFLARYPGLTDPTGFVDSLNANAGMVLNDAQRDALISELSANQSDPVLRADVLFKVAENTVLQQREFNRAFVLMEYFGYLRRNPDAAPEPTLNFNGYNFWLGKLNQFNGDYIGAEMIKGFLGSSEYRRRFGP